MSNTTAADDEKSGPPGEWAGRGLRPVEVGEDVAVLESGVSNNIPVGTPKGRKRADQRRTIPMQADLAERLRRRLAASIGGLVFTAPSSRPLSSTNWRSRVWAPIVEPAGVDANPHDLRHTCAFGPEFERLKRGQNVVGSWSATPPHLTPETTNTPTV